MLRFVTTDHSSLGVDVAESRLYPSFVHQKCFRVQPSAMPTAYFTTIIRKLERAAAGKQRAHLVDQVTSWSSKVALAATIVTGDRGPSFGQSCLDLSLGMAIVEGHLASDLREKRMLALAEASN